MPHNLEAMLAAVSMVTRGKISETESAYLAGIIDGEGSISFDRRPPQQRNLNEMIQPALTITNTSVELMEWLNIKFVGATSARPLVKPNWKQCWRWKVVNQAAFTICQLVLPYLIVKRQQAELVVRFYTEALPKVQHVSVTSLKREDDSHYVLSHTVRSWTQRRWRKSAEEMVRQRALWFECRRLNDWSVRYHPQRLSEGASNLEDAIV